MEQTVNWEKVYVDTLVRHTKDGGSIPLSIKFSDGKTYEIDQVLGRKRAAASRRRNRHPVLHPDRTASYIPL